MYNTMAECESHYSVDYNCEYSAECHIKGDKAPKIKKIVLASNKK